MVNGFRLQPRAARVGHMVYARNPRLPGVIVALLTGDKVCVQWISGRASEQSTWGPYDFEIRLDEYMRDLTYYQNAALTLRSQIRPQRESSTCQISRRPHAPSS